jgi:hypothetical protein
MRLSTVVLALVVVLASCSSTRKSTGAITSPASGTLSDAKGNDGSSYEKAIVIDKKNETEGVAAEYQWIRENYPDYSVTGQSLQQNGKKWYDVLHTTNKNEIKRDFYFDITKFFGKM